MEKVLVTGAKGFIAGYLIEDLLDRGYQVVGLDNFSKYGNVTKSYDSDPNYEFIEGDAQHTEMMKILLTDCDHFIAGAAKIGGISYFHQHAYDLLSENERILAASFDAAIYAFQHHKLKKITPLSSSMVYENTDKYPTPEGEEFVCPPPSSTYGFQKLAVEYFAYGAWQQYGLPFTLCLPFNCIGTGESKALTDTDIYSGNIKMALSHVVPDLIQKILKGQDPLILLGSGEQVRHYTYAGDLARGIRLAMENMDNSINETFNLSTPIKHTVKELAEIIWNKINTDKPFRYTTSEGFEHDVPFRSPDTSKAKRLLDFEAKVKLEDALDEIIPWYKEAIEKGLI